MHEARSERANEHQVHVPPAAAGCLSCRRLLQELREAKRKIRDLEQKATLRQWMAITTDLGEGD